jgi:hypothetical protein
MSIPFLFRNSGWISFEADEDRAFTAWVASENCIKKITVANFYGFVAFIVFKLI